MPGDGGPCAAAPGAAQPHLQLNQVHRNVSSHLGLSMRPCLLHFSVPALRIAPLFVSLCLSQGQEQLSPPPPASYLCASLGGRINVALCLLLLIPVRFSGVELAWPCASPQGQRKPLWKPRGPSFRGTPREAPPPHPLPLAQRHGPTPLSPPHPARGRVGAGAPRVEGGAAMRWCASRSRTLAWEWTRPCAVGSSRPSPRWALGAPTLTCNHTYTSTYTLTHNHTYTSTYTRLRSHSH